MVAPSSLEHERNTPLFVVAKLGLEFSYFSERNLKLSTSYPVKHDTRVWQPWDNWTRSLLMPPCFMHNNDQVQKQLGKFFNRQLHIPWVNLIWSSHYLNNLPQHANLCGSFWWKDIVQLETLVRGSAHPIINNGASVSFWNDFSMEELWHKLSPFCFPLQNTNMILWHSILQGLLMISFFCPLSSSLWWVQDLLAWHITDYNLLSLWYMEIHVGKWFLLFSEILHALFLVNPAAIFALDLEM